jgi:GTPase SAR1 family protein
MCGFFKNVFRPQKSSKIENYDDNIIYDIVCPKCFKKFSPNSVVFRAGKYYKNEGEFTLGPDTVLNDFNRNRGSNDVTEIERVIDPAVDDRLIQSRNIVDGIIVEITDVRGIKTSQRLCPYCHNILPNSAGRGPCEVISVIGTTQVGKSVLMASLLHTMQSITSGNFDAGCIPINTRYCDELRRLERTIYDDGMLLPPTQKEDTIEPLILNFKFKDSRGKPITFMFFDVAGEGMNDIEYIDRHAVHIKNSTGIIFLIDPLQLPAIRSRIVEANPMFENVFMVGPEVIISTLFENFIVLKEGEENDIPTAIVITKSDLLNIVKGDYVQEGSNIFRNYNHKGYFNLQEFYNIHGEVGNLLGRVDSAFKNAVEAYFTDYGYFAVSSLGSNPDERRLTGIVNSIRIDEPLLWIMYRKGYIRPEREGFNKL